MSDNKFVRILSDGFQKKEEAPARPETIGYRPVETAPVAPRPVEVRSVEPTPQPEQQVSISIEPEQDPNEVLLETIASLRGQVEELQMTIRELRANPPVPDMSVYMTSREMVKSLTAAIENENTAMADKRIVETMTQIATMREDFFKLCTGMRAKLKKMPKEDMVSSFEAYEVDMENILTDRGVFIGHFPFDELNTTHQRIVEVVPTNDQSQNGRIAERLSDGYKLGDRVLYKEKVSVYKYTETPLKTTSGKSRKKKTEDVPQTASETVSEQTEKATTENKSEEEE